jgi:glycosyltransferase involved in cell wall biosynthesis
MRVLFVLPQIVFHADGGVVGGYVNSAINVMEEMQFHAEVALIAGVHRVTPANREHLRSRLGNVSVILLPISSKPTTASYFAEFLVKVALAASGPQKATFVYGHSGHPAYALATWAVSRRMNAIAVHALYCPIEREFQNRKTSAISRLLMRAGLNRVRHIVAISNNVQRSIRDFSRGAYDSVVVPPAIEDALYVQPTPSSAPNADVKAGFVGHHLPEKGFDIALDVLLDDLPDGRRIALIALLSGSKSMTSAREEAQAMVKARGLQDRVTMLYEVKDMRDFYSSIDLMLIPFRGTRGPSDYPMVLLEAMVRQVPVVSTPVGAVPEIIVDRRNGFLSRDISAAAFSRSLREAVGSDIRRNRTLSLQARTDAERFRASRVSALTLEHFRLWQQTRV